MSTDTTHTTGQQDMYAAPGETSQGRVFTVTGQD
jgi:NADH-quinone oxidoreductase subunit D